METLQKWSCRNGAAWFDVVLTAVLLLTLYPAVPSFAQGTGTTYQGFGAETRGGDKQPRYEVTTLADSGPGSLRDAVSQGNRYIVFRVAGTIEAKSKIWVRGANITIDGFDAPGLGITLKNFGLNISGNEGAHDIIVRGIRVHIVSDARGKIDGITVRAGAHNVVIDHVSIRGASDENIGINKSHNVTVSWSILAEPLNTHNTNMLIYQDTTRVSFITIFF